MPEELRETQKDVCRTIGYIRAFLWRPNIYSQIKEHLKSYESCRMLLNKSLLAPWFASGHYLR